MKREEYTQDRRGVLLLSGGIDSTVTLALAKLYKWDVICLCVDYGQSHSAEIDAATTIAAANDSELVVVEAPLRVLSPSRLTGLPPAVPRTLEELRQEQGPSPYYVPGRNTILLSFALGLCEARGLNRVFIGATLEDAAGFRDCRPEYLDAYSAMGALALGRTGFRVEAPLGMSRKVDVVRIGLDLGVDLSNCVTCYHATADGACGRCDACMIRVEAFEKLGRVDPGRYR